MLCGAPVAEHTAPDALTAAALLPPEPGAHNARLAGPTGAGGGNLLIATAGAEQGCTGVTLRLWGPGTDQVGTLFVAPGCTQHASSQQFALRNTPSYTSKRIVRVRAVYGPYSLCIASFSSLLADEFLS